MNWTEQLARTILIGNPKFKHEDRIMELLNCVLGLLEFLVVKGYNAALSVGLSCIFLFANFGDHTDERPWIVQCAGT